MIFNSLYFVYGLLAVILVLAGIIAFLRFLFLTIYATGNAKDILLLELMEGAGIPVCLPL
ncbi:MAG: hypothetical protein ACFB2X_14590 [Rivularia sp. (in: cyanobacteria)]|mgnify:CR=1 FL=1